MIQNVFGYYFDSETGFYYLKSRYYDPETGRFLNADGYVSTGQGVLSTNMFAYCDNNPVNRIDSTGQSWTDIKNFLKKVGKTIVNASSWAGFARISVNKAIANAKKYQASFSYSAKNKDGSYSLYDNQRKNTNSLFHEQILSGSFSGPSFSLKESNISLGSASATLMTGGWEFEHVDISPLDVLHAEAGFGYQDGQFNASAIASAWSPSVTINIWDLEITVTGYVGSAGGKVNFGAGNVSVNASVGLGFGISVNW